MFNSVDIIVICAAPILGSLIGYATNVIAVKMLFHPRNPRRILGFKFHGVIPRRRTEIAKRFAEVVSKELVTNVEIEKSVDFSKIEKTLVESIDTEITRFINEKISSIPPMFAAFISDSLIENLKGSVVKEIANRVPKFIAEVKSDISNNFNIHEIVEEKVLNFSIEKLEEVVLTVSKQEFKNIERLGGVLGFIIGLAQSAIYLVSKLV